MRVNASSVDELGPLDPRRVRFVLVEPQFGGNVGQAARALKNLGFSRLAIVRPACDPKGKEARMMAVDAADVLERIEAYEDLEAALEGALTVVGTSRRTGKHRQPHFRLDQLTPDLARLAIEGDLAVVFGREDHGLSDAALDRCTHLVHLLASEDYASFNLAQAVLLVAYELRLWSAGASPSADPHGAPADHAAREAMYRHLEQSLTAIGFLSRDTAEPIMRRLRRMFGRAEMTPEEVKLLRGMARQTLWVAARAGLAVPSELEPD